uniref:Ferrochelatase n=1 Tax=Panagrellus redivivus TaxID=6233 RepID=A0A7E4VHB5_PANRE
MSSKVALSQIVAKLTGSQNVQAVAPSKIGILLINTGTPSGYGFWPMWRYLRQFLSDSRIVEAPRVIWYPILYLWILVTRPFKKGKAYEAIWDMSQNESPLRRISRNQSTALQTRLDTEALPIPVKVTWAFRYGTPSIPSAVNALKASGCDRLIALPLFPQYSAATVASCSDVIFETLATHRRQMALHVVPEYYNNPAYIEAIVDTIRDKITTVGGDFDALVVTYHGIPLTYQQKGDPYGGQCHATTALIVESLKKRGFGDLDVVTSFQSRLGHKEWLKPYTDELVVEMAKNGYKRILLVAPGFSSDCLETLEELELDLVEEFKHNGGTELVYVPCLNDTPSGIEVIEKIIKSEINA